MQRIKILTTPWRDTQPRMPLATVANGAIRSSFINDEDFEGTKVQQEITKEQLEVMIPPSHNGDGDPPPEPV